MSVGLGLQEVWGGVPLGKRVIESLWAEEDRKEGVLEGEDRSLSIPVRGKKGIFGLLRRTQKGSVPESLIEWTLRPGYLCSDPSATIASHYDPGQVLNLRVSPSLHL